MPEPAVSAVIPLCNEAATLVELSERLRATLVARQVPFEIVYVDDGSTDGTGPLLRRLEAEDARIRVFELTRNFGQAAALACGMFAARGDVVVTLDGDLQNPPEEIPRLLDALDKGADVATGARGRRYEGRARWLGSRVIHRLARRLTGVDIQDYGGQFKAYRRHVVERVRQLWAPGKPIFPLALWLGFPVVEVTVRHDPRRSGRSRYHLRSLLRINVDLVTSFSTLPLALLGVTGAGLFAAGFAGLVLCLGLRPAGWLPGAAALVTIAVGAIFLAAGVLGQYLGRVYRQVAGEAPAWVVRSGPARNMDEKRRAR